MSGYIKTQIDIPAAMGKLESYLRFVPEKYSQFSCESLLFKPALNKWSRQEILGHLVDSAINNLKRFTEIQFLPQPYIVQSYQQDELVKLNNYQNVQLNHLLDLWKALNQQIIHVVKNISPEKLKYPVDPQYENTEMKTLGWIIVDYVAHMEHHLRQVGISE